jgi:hypothetical protein
MALGGLIAWGILRTPATKQTSQEDPRITKLQNELRTLQLQLQAQALEAQKKPEAKEAAAAAAIASAKDVGLPPPSEDEIEKKALRPETKEAEKKAVDDAASKLQTAEAKPENTSSEPDCATLAAMLKDSSKEKLTDPKTLELLKKCKAEADQKTQQDKKDYQDSGCPDHPNTPECQQKRQQIHDDNSVNDLIKLILVAAAIYLIMDGDVATGLLLLSLANGGGPGGAGGGGPEQDGAPTPTVSAPGATPSATNATASTATTFPGTGGTLVCEIPTANTLSCYSRGDPTKKRVPIDPSNTIVDLSRDPDRARVAQYLADAIKNRTQVITFCAPRTQSQGNGVLDEVVLKHEDSFYAITISTDSYKLGIPPTGSSTQPPCEQ